MFFRSRDVQKTGTVHLVHRPRRDYGTVMFLVSLLFVYSRLEAQCVGVAAVSGAEILRETTVATA